MKTVLVIAAIMTLALIVMVIDAFLRTHGQLLK
jgi:hypothetical protein